MNWNKLSDKQPKEDECPSGRVLLYWKDFGIYDTWGIRSKMFDLTSNKEGTFWTYIDTPPSLQDFWYQK